MSALCRLWLPRRPAACHPWFAEVPRKPWQPGGGFFLAVATQRLVARAVLRDAGADLVTTLLEDPPGIADLPVTAF